MADTLIYILQVNIGLVLFSLAYWLTLRPLTFYTINRVFLMFGIAFSFSFPLINLPIFIWPNVVTHYVPSFESVHVQAAAPVSLVALAILFWMGVVTMALRLFVQLASLYMIHMHSTHSCFNGVWYRNVGKRINPFTFWRSIYLNPEQHQESDLAPILCHEQVHVRQWHTVDVLLSELCRILCWFNPVVWLFVHSVKENIEFIADREVIKSGIERKVYQYSLIRIGATSHAPTPVNNFNLLTIKNRIRMMNKMKSPIMHIARYLVLVPLVIALAFSACSEINEVPLPEATIKEHQEAKKASAAQPNIPVVVVSEEPKNQEK
ncbi:M56 family metallopeptidase [Pontibacter pamirensis]|uniref:M56 family metallopeptidase n=1 Tax=Pontibacter pamirensis TaxID=2562824 RepID=UPI00138A06EA|nr:M56 family metallopeptidase [Pontibacter pamirensis]